MCAVAADSRADRAGFSFHTVCMAWFPQAGRRTRIPEFLSECTSLTPCPEDKTNAVFVRCPVWHRTARGSRRIRDGSATSAQTRQGCRGYYARPSLSQILSRTLEIAASRREYPRKVEAASRRLIRERGRDAASPLGTAQVEGSSRTLGIAASRRGAAPRNDR